MDKATAPQSVPTPIYRKQNPSTFAQPNVKLARTLVYRELALELTGAATVTAANNTAANTLMGDEWACVQNLNLLVNGSDSYRNFSGDDLWWLNWFWYGTAPATTATIGDAATANPAFDSTLLLPMWMPNTFHPFDTLLDSGRFNDVSLNVTYGGFASINSAATAWTTQPQIALTSQEQVLPQSPTDQPKLNWVAKKYQNTPAGANNSYRIPLDAGVNYARFLINVKKSDGTADAGSTTYATSPQSLVSNIKVVGAGGRVYADRSYTELQQTSRLKRDLLQSVSRRSQGSNSGAWVELDLVADGRLTEAMPNPQDAYIELNVGGACQVNVIASIIYPV